MRATTLFFLVLAIGLGIGAALMVEIVMRSMQGIGGAL